MPLYEYECGKCAHRFELRRRFGEDGGATCPVCAGDSRRVFCPVPIVFKGSGFYVTDYPKEKTRVESADKPASGTPAAANAGAETKPAAKPAESKPATATAAKDTKSS